MAFASKSVFRGLIPLPTSSNSLSSVTSSCTTVLPSLFSTSLSIPISIHLRLPSLLSDIWDSVLRAVPKKRTSYRKKRQRQLAGKALKDVTALSKCPGCGSIKKAHTLCPVCVKDIQAMWKKQSQQTSAASSSTS